MSHRLTWPRALAIALAIAAGLGLFGVTVATADFNYDAPAHVVAPPERVAPVASPSTTATPNARIVALVARPAPTGVRRASTSSSSLSRAAKAGERTLGPWFAPGKWLPHFEKHAGEFGYKNSVEYLKGARDLVGREGVETFTRANGDRLFYDAARNEFAAMRPDGVLRTYFRPRDGADYWRTQIGG